MKTAILVLCGLLIVAAICLPMILAAVGVIGGILLFLFGGLGLLLFIGFIFAVIAAGARLLVFGIFGLIGVILLAIALPILAPLFIVLIPVIILIKLVSR